MLRDNEANLQDDADLFGNDFYITMYTGRQKQERAQEIYQWTSPGL